jgi:hypothetical protein
MTNKKISSFSFLVVALFCTPVFAKLDFALTCVGSGQSMVLIAEHNKDSERVLQGLDDLTDAVITTTKPSFNRIELRLAKEDEKQFFYVENKNWFDSDSDKENFFFLDRDTLKLQRYSRLKGRYNDARAVGIFSCKISSNPLETNLQVEKLFNKKLEEREDEKQKQLKRNKI